MTRLVGSVAITLALGAVLVAQDTVTLKDGRRLRGEIQSETEDAVTIITRMGEVRKLSGHEIERVARGRPLKREVEVRLALVDAKVPDDLFGVVLWASKKSSLKFAAMRVARRILATDWLPLALSLLAMAVSMGMDEFVAFGETSNLVEDGAKFTGIVLWLAYFAHAVPRLASR